MKKEIKLLHPKPKYKAPPGTLVYTGLSSKDTTIKHFKYKDHEFQLNEDQAPLSEDQTDWIVIEGLKDVEKVKEICSSFNIDRLVIEDILNVTQRNKVDIFDDYLFTVLKYPYLDNDMIRFRDAYFVLFKDVLLTFTDFENPFVEEITRRIQHSEAILSRYHEDYLYYVLYDLIVDEQMAFIKELKDSLNNLESRIMDIENTSRMEIHRLHKNLVVLKHNINSQRENVSPSSLKKQEFIRKELLKYFDDIDDHLKNSSEKLSNAIDVINSLINLYSTSLSNHMNDIMKTLTIISVVFIPLSFLAGVFGMNFTHFDVLSNPYGLSGFIGTCILIGIGMLIYFKRIKWF